MSQSALPEPTLVFSKGETLQFFAALDVAFQSMSKAQLEDAYLYVKNRNAIAILYDAELHPFLGFNEDFIDPDNRVLIPGYCHVLGEIRSRLRSQPHDIPGGRVFLGNHFAVRAIDSGTDTLCQWTWLGDPLIGTALSMLDAALSGHV